MTRTLPLLLVAILVLPTVGVSAPPVCPDGRFLLVDQEPLAGGAPAPAIDAVILAEATLAVASGCPPVPAKVVGTRRGTRISATWPKGACAGLPSKVRLKGTIDSTCNHLRGRLRVKKRGRRFEAQRSGCGDGVLDRDGGEACPTLEGAPDGLALDAISNFQAAIPIPEAANDVDAIGRRLVRTRLELAFFATTTVGELNALLTRLEARISSMLPGVRSVVVDIPDPGSVAALDALVADLEAEPIVDLVFKAYEPSLDALPPNFTAPLGATAGSRLDHHLAVGAAAAWNARGAMRGQPGVVILDAFGDGVPDAALDAVVVVPGIVASGNPDPNGHGYHVAGIVAASFGGDATGRGQATGMFPAQSALSLVDMQGTTTSFLDDLNLTLGALVFGPPNGILNTSLGTDCNTPFNDLVDEARWWTERVRVLGLESRVLHLTTAGNIKPACPAEVDSDVSSRWTAAALVPLGEPNLTNVLAIENAQNDVGPDFAPRCLDASSKTRGHLAGIGTNVLSLTGGSSGAGELTGTSMASPQVAGLAAYLWALDPGMSVQELRGVLLATARAVPGSGGLAGCSALEPAPVIDAYAAVLSLDEAVLPTPTSAPVRHALMDVDGDGFFDEDDLLAWRTNLIDVATGELTEPADPDFGRHDLNGDGFTGGAQRTARFDLDRIDSVQFGASGHGVVLQAIGGVDVPFDETQARDLDILCYYAYSDLFEGTDTARNDTLPFERCVRAGTEVVFPTQVSPGTPTPLAVRVVAIEANSGTLGPLAGVRVELSPSGGTVAALTGITDAEGFFETTATAASNATTFTIDIVVRRTVGSPELVQDFAQAAVGGTPSVRVTARTATIHAEAFAIGASPALVEEDHVALPDFTTFIETSTAQRSGEATTAEAFVSQSTNLAIDAAGALGGISSQMETTATGSGVNADARGKSDLGIDFEVTSGSVAYVLSGSIDAAFAGPEQEGKAGVSFFFQGPGVQISGIVGTGSLFGGPPSQTLSSTGILGPGRYEVDVQMSTQAQAHDRSESQSASWDFTLTLSPVIGTTSTSTSSSTTTTTSTLPSSSTTSTSTTSTTTTTLFGLPVIPYARYDATGPDGPVVTLADEFVTEAVDLGAVILELPPVTIDGELPFDPLTHQTCHAHPGGTLDACIDVQDRFGAAPLRIGNPVGVCTRERSTAIAVDNFKCYQANGSALEADVVLEDAFQSQAVTVGAPELLCTPVAVDGEPLVNPLRYLVCYATTPLGTTGGQIEVDDVLHPDSIQVDVGVATGLCVPAVRQLPASCQLCGNGVVDGAEDCDDAGVLDGDGCSAVCRFELDCTCDGLPLPPPNDERCATLADCGGSCTGCSAVGGVCGCQ